VILTHTGAFSAIRLSRQVALSHVLFDPLKCEAIYQFLINGNLHGFEVIMGERQSCLIGGSGYD
jgi:hypothetical protein